MLTLNYEFVKTLRDCFDFRHETDHIHVNRYISPYGYQPLTCSRQRKASTENSKEKTKTAEIAVFLCRSRLINSRICVMFFIVIKCMEYIYIWGVKQWMQAI